MTFPQKFLDMVIADRERSGRREKLFLYNLFGEGEGRNVAVWGFGSFGS